MAKAKQLPSGSWRVQVSTGAKNEKGKYIYESITRPTKEEALYAAAEYSYKRKKQKKAPQKIKLKDACLQYIKDGEGRLSPSTIRGYNCIVKNNIQDLMDINVDKLTQENIQKAFDKEAKSHSPKTVKNIHGFLSAILAVYAPDFTLKTNLPAKEKFIPYIPDLEELTAIFKATKNTEIEIPVLLGAWLGLRESEICGINKKEHIDFKKSTLTVKEAVVRSDNGWVRKKTKTAAGTRILPLPKYILDKIKALPSEQESVTTLSGNAIHERFVKMLKDNNLHHMRFHDLRSTNASIMLSLNIPDKYAMQRMGHETDIMLKNVYQRTINQKSKEVDDLLTEYFMKLI